MEDKIKRAHLARAKELYDDPEKETPGSFEEFFAGQYVDEYGGGGKKEDNRNRAVIQRYASYLAQAREGQQQSPQPLLAGGEGKGPYPANEEEDYHLLAQIMKFLKGLQKDLVEAMRLTREDLVAKIAELAAHIAAKLVTEIRQQREVTDETETAILTIVCEDMWTRAANRGAKKVDRETVMNSIQVAASIYNQLEEQMKQDKPMQKVGPLGGGQEPMSQDLGSEI